MLTKAAYTAGAGMLDDSLDELPLFSERSPALGPSTPNQVSRFAKQAQPVRFGVYLDNSPCWPVHAAT